MNERALVLLGAGGHAREVASCLIRANGGDASVFAGLLADWVPRSTESSGLGSSHLGPISRLRDLPYRYLVAIGSSQDRRYVAHEVESMGKITSNVVDPSALIGDRVQIGSGVYIAAGVIITVDAVIGDHVHLNVRCSVHHDVCISPYSTVGPGTVLCGSVSIGEAADLGAGAIVLPGITVGDEAVVGAGAVVIRDVAPGEVIVGVPGRARRPHS